MESNGESKTYHCSLEVRGYEIDGFGHVNNAVYLNYLEFARWKMLHSQDITLQKFQNWKRWPVIAKVEMEYLKPVFGGETLNVRTRVVGHRKASFVLEQEIWRGETKVLRATLHSVFVDETGRPASVPEQMNQVWQSA